MSSMHNDPILAVAIRAARRAASVLVDAARDLKRLPSFSKEHGDIVASADSDAEDAIVATLRAAYPDHAILGEESGHIPGARDSAGHKWIVDPLDGSANFAHGYPHYAVSIALAHGRDVTHAVVLDPLRDELFTAAAGKGAQLNGTPLRASSCTRLADALVGTVFPPRASPSTDAYLRLFTALLPRCAGLRRAGACSLDLCYVAAGRLDALFTISVQGWDVAAGALIVKEAGGRVGDFAGAGDILGTKQVIGASAGLFGPLREAIAAALPRQA
jgi:myo-inositol-1(or 4)-monophosphatase